jgi:formate/nitrite transporter FocA (FNT family)
MSIHTPPEIIRIAGEAAMQKDEYPVKKILTLAFLAGAYTAFGGLLSVVLAGGMPEITSNNPSITKFILGAAFPIGLILVVMAGAELLYRQQCLLYP